MQIRYLVSMFMDSPFYFELTPRERLLLLQDHRRRFGGMGAAGPHETVGKAESAAPDMDIDATGLGKNSLF